MTHARISVSALSSVRWSFEKDLALWRDLGVGWAGLMSAKLGDGIEAGLTALAEAGIRASTVVVPRFDLRTPATWDATRETHRRWIDAVAKHDGWSIYLTTGRTTGDPWEQALDTLATAIAPSVEYARDRGVRLGFEPSLRTEVSFVTNLKDAIDVAERTGLGIVADIGNFWMERDLRATLLRAAPHIALAQLTDVSIGTVRSPDDPPTTGRVPFGEGDLPIARILRDLKDTGYAGPFDLELIGPLGDSEGYEPTIRRGVVAAEAMLHEAGLLAAGRQEATRQRSGEMSSMTRTSRAVVMPGDGSWELRELRVPDPPPGGAVLRVEAVGMCHSDIDHMHGIVHTPWGGAYPSIPGHEIVGRIDSLAAGTGARWGVAEGQRVAVRESVPLPGGFRVYGHDFGIDERSGLFGGFADYMELLPETLVELLPEDIPADELTVWEPLAIAVRWATAVKPGDSVAILGPGHLGLASIVAARAAGAERIFITGTASDALRLEAARRLGVEETIDISATDPLERLRELTGDGVDVVIDAASASTSTVTQGMQMAKRGGTVVIGGLKDRKPVQGFISDWIPMRQLHLHAGFPGDHVKTSIELIRQGKVPTADLLGETVTVDGLGEALSLLARESPGRDAIRLALRMTG